MNFLVWAVINSAHVIISKKSLIFFLSSAVLFAASFNPLNTRAKKAMMAAVARHMDNVEESKNYYNKKLAEGKKNNQAVRALGRHLVRVIWSMLKRNRDYELRK